MIENSSQHNYWEHAEFLIQKLEFPDEIEISSKKFGNSKDRFCFEVRKHEDCIKLRVGYFIGVDWLLENHRSIHIAPKLNSRIEALKEQAEEEIELDIDTIQSDDIGSEIFIDYFAMLNRCLKEEYLYREIDDLVYIDWNATPIPITQDKDFLSPLIIVKFLNVLKTIVRKGLKKSYYLTIQNLNSKIKGKVLVGQNIKQNVFKNRFLKTLCQYEEFGIDDIENRVLKKALKFAAAYLDDNKKLFSGANNHYDSLIGYCRPAFEFVGDEIDAVDIKSYKANPFFKEYNEGISLAKLILKRFGYNISNTTNDRFTTPPYWIDMPKLFELYAYHFLKSKFPNINDLSYHTATYGNELDFLIDSNGLKMVVDAKYKPLYIYGKNHQDIRQVSGYARLKKVFDILDIKEDKLIDCLIIYPDVESGLDLESFDLDKKQEIGGYRNVYKIGIKLPRK